MTEQYQKGSLVMQYLKKLDVHPINIGQAVTNENYRKSYQLIKENPNISKEDFLTAMGIEEWEESEATFSTPLTKMQELLIRGLKLFPMTPKERETIFRMLKTEEERWALMIFMKENRGATAQEIKRVADMIIELTSKKPID